MNVLIKPGFADAASTAKLEQIAAGFKPRVLDLFSGAGGISLGFQRAGFQIEGALEIEPLPALTHALNFHGNDPELTKLHAQPRDMTRVEPDQLASELRLGPVEDAIDVLVGGPPCQAYARVGRAKLREVADHPEAYKVDPRGNLFLRYLAYVKAFRPLALLMENVPDILHYGGHNVIEEMVEALDGLGYAARYSLINSAFHGCTPDAGPRVSRRLSARTQSENRVPSGDAPHGVAAGLRWNASRGLAVRGFARGHGIRPARPWRRNSTAAGDGRGGNRRFASN